MGRPTLRLLAPLLVLLIPFALLVGLGVNYVGLVEADHERNLREQAEQLLDTWSQELSHQVLSITDQSLTILDPTVAPPQPRQPGQALDETISKKLQEAGQVSYVTSAFLLDENNLIYPRSTNITVVGARDADVPFERLTTRYQDEWARIDQIITDCLRTESYTWALEEITKARQSRSARSQSFSLFLDFQQAVVLRVQAGATENKGEASTYRERARKQFLAIATKLEKRKSRMPTREILLVRYEAALLAPTPQRWDELMTLAQGIVTDKWHNTQESFLQDMLFQKIIPILENQAPQKFKDQLDADIRPRETVRENRHAFYISMLVGKNRILERIENTPADQLGASFFLDMRTNDNIHLLACSPFAPGRRKLVDGVAIDLEKLVLDQAAAMTNNSVGADEDILRASLRTPHNKPVANLLPTNESTETSPVVITERSLASPLQGFRLQAILENPEISGQRANRNRWRLGLYLATLSLMTGAGAFFLLRNLRREMELVRLKADFISRVSHDLKTPLALIRLYAETLTMGRAVAKEQVEKFGGIITKECDQLTGMIERVLTFSQMERGLTTYQPTTGQIETEVQEILTTYAPEVKHQKVELTQDLAPTPALAFDREGLRRSLLNLLDNAAKFGGGNIEVRLGVQDNQVRLEVMDRGAGIPESERSRIFEPFIRGAGAEERRGSGLGLSLVKHFATNHGGSIAALPREGGGTIMRLTLPLEK